MFNFNRRTKYGNTKILFNGVKFDSKRELRRYQQLLALQAAKEIKDLKLQVKFLLQEGFKDIQGEHHKPISYIADFTYLDRKYNWHLVVEDSKGFKTPVYLLKKKLLLKKYPEIIFIET